MTVNNRTNASPSSTIKCLEEALDDMLKPIGQDARHASNAKRGASAEVYDVSHGFQKVARQPMCRDNFDISPEVTCAMRDQEIHGRNVLHSGGALPYESAGFDTRDRIAFKPSADIKAPLLPSYLDLPRTTFRSTKPLADLVKEIKNAFGACSVAAKSISIDNEKTSDCAWDCTMERALARVRLEVRVFTTESTPPPSGVGHHLVVVCHMRGCWDAFSEGAADLATALGVEYDDNQPLAEGFMLASPAPVSDKTLLETQQKSSSGKEVNASTGGSEELRTARYLLTLMSSDADWESQVAGCRAVGALALEVAGTGTYHRNHNYAIFASSGAWLELAKRVQCLASATFPQTSSWCEEEQGELQSVAMAAVANVAALEHVCNRWLAQAVNTASRALVNPANDDAHVKHEALRAAHVLSKRDSALAQQLAAVDGFLDALELVASNDDWSCNSSVTVDAQAVKFAQGVRSICDHVHN